MSLANMSFRERLRLRRGAAGLTQRELAALSGVKQPMIAALERGTRSPSSEAERRLESSLQLRPSALLHAAREKVLAAANRLGDDHARVFGSVASGEDEPGSDVELLVHFLEDADTLTLRELEEELSDLLTVPVDVVSGASGSPSFRAALAEAVPL